MERNQVLDPHEARISFLPMDAAEEELIGHCRELVAEENFIKEVRAFELSSKQKNGIKMFYLKPFFLISCWVDAFAKWPCLCKNTSVSSVLS